VPLTSTSISRGKSKDKDKAEKRVLKKLRRSSGQQQQGTLGSVSGSAFSSPSNSPIPTPSVGVSRMLGIPLGGRDRDREGGS